ncbi:Structural maintenance of chromosomes protein 2, partial [Rhizoclosmatium hyalinum]
GTLSGGSRNKSSNTLAKFQEYTKVRKELSAEEKALERLSEEICSAETVLGEYQKAEKKLELATHECALLEKQIESNANSQAIFQVENIQKEIDVETQRIEDSKSAVAELTERCKSLELEMRKFSTHKEETLGALKKEIQAEKKALVEETKKIQAEELKVQTLVQERIQLQQEMQTFETTETSLKATISGLMAEQEALKEKQSNMKDIIKSMEEKLSMERKTMLSHDTEMQAFEKTLKSNQKKIADQAGVLMRLRTEFENGSIECKKAASLLKEVTNNPENAWISDLKTIEKKESSLVTKISTVMKDKNKIEETIDSLEKYKIDKLLKTWEKVSHDFGLIFGDLLPGNSAKLTPADGKNIGSGLEVQVCLGGVWKENLTELSGGQRSLVALSLILALLQFKPAPMYILDEVDSALDESHTQNIGQLLKNRFKGAQFILVSLKDGMYTNANVLFRTKFRDGVSTIE